MVFEETITIICFWAVWPLPSKWFYDGFLMLLPSLSMVFDGSGPLVKRCDGFDGSLWSSYWKWIYPAPSGTKRATRLEIYCSGTRTFLVGVCLAQPSGGCFFCISAVQFTLLRATSDTHCIDWWKPLHFSFLQNELVKNQTPCLSTCTGPRVDTWNEGVSSDVSNEQG